MSSLKTGLESFRRAVFVKTAMKLSQCPTLRNPQGQEIAEIAVFGRSNVGKSSLLNDLFSQKGLVKTSATPGKTQAINFFQADQIMVFADLPGYGFAKVPPELQAHWGQMVQEYLDQRGSLRVVLFLFDCRREPVAEDLELFRWMQSHSWQTLLIVTKTDKLTASQCKRVMHSLTQKFAVKAEAAFPYSVKENVSRSNLQRRLLDVIKQPPTAQALES